MSPETQEAIALGIVALAAVYLLWRLMRSFLPKRAKATTAKDGCRSCAPAATPPPEPASAKPASTSLGVREREREGARSA